MGKSINSLQTLFGEMERKNKLLKLGITIACIVAGGELVYIIIDKAF